MIEEKIYEFAGPPRMPERKPSKLVAKIPMSMYFIDDKNQCFFYSKYERSFVYMYSVFVDKSN